MSNNRIRWRMLYLIASLGIYLMDQASKAWAVRRLRLHDVTGDQRDSRLFLC